MEPMFLCGECLKIYEKPNAIERCEEDQKSTTCDECGRVESELTFPMYWVLADFEIQYRDDEEEE